MVRPTAADDRQREDQHRGGSGNFAEDTEKPSEAGRKGGQSNEVRSGGSWYRLGNQY
ncbi:MAG: hypothetical protein EOS71_27845 [Mesorhizobium sp.]|nr:MAG: hypothetical protein EOS71_27845 [Mesorhizobium sp.]